MLGNSSGCNRWQLAFTSYMCRESISSVLNSSQRKRENKELLEKGRTSRKYNRATHTSLKHLLFEHSMQMWSPSQRWIGSPLGKAEHNDQRQRTTSVRAATKRMSTFQLRAANRGKLRGSSQTDEVEEFQCSMCECRCHVRAGGGSALSFTNTILGCRVAGGNPSLPQQTPKLYP